MKITEAGIDSGGIALKKIEWDDGQWWIFRTEINWGTSRQIRKAISELGEKIDRIDSAQEVQGIRVIGSTEEWSFKLGITQPSVDRIADWRIRHVLEEMLERQRVEVTTEETKKASVWRSFLRSLSLLTGRRRSVTKT